jgi:uncharacterized protein (DUF58 family)
MKRYIHFLGFLLFWAGIGLLALIKGGFTAWFLFYAASFMLVYFVALLISSLHGVKVERSLKQTRYLAGDAMDVTVTIRHKSWMLLIWLIIEDEWEREGEAERHTVRKMVFPWLRREVVCKYKARLNQRGKYAFKQTNVYTGDCFGFILRKKSVAFAQPFIVYPKPIRLYRRPLPVRNSKYSGQVRDYVHGDPMNRIHWKSSARSLSLKTKEKEVSAGGRMYVFLEAAPERYRSAAAFEHCISIASGILKEAADKKAEAELVCCGGKEQGTVSIQKLDMLQIDDYLAGIRQRGKEGMESALNQRSSALSSDVSVVCITAALEKPFIQALVNLRRKKCAVEVIYIYEGTVMSWHERQSERLLEQLGCSFLSVPCPQKPEQGGVDDVGA